MNMKSLIHALFAVAMSYIAQAANPFLPGWEYIPDGEPRVFGDRVYLYGSHDRAGSKEFCDTILRVWSAPLADLNTWTDHGIIFSTRTVDGHADDVDWSDNNLYAPDVVGKDGRYYLFAQIVGSPCAVAVSDTPAGPFRLISQIKKPKDSPMDFGGWSQYFDPGVLVDDDGKVYLYWGGGSSHMAQLNPANMTEILPDTYRANILPTQPPFNYQEGPWPEENQSCVLPRLCRRGGSFLHHQRLPERSVLLPRRHRQQQRRRTGRQHPRRVGRRSTASGTFSIIA